MTEPLPIIASKPRTEALESRAALSRRARPVVTLSEHIVEIISDSGEGAQRCGQSLGSIAAQMGNGIWTVEIIPAEIRPPARSVAGAQRQPHPHRIAGRVTNGGDETDLVIAFNEQVLLGRVRAGELKPGCTILLESMWREPQRPQDRAVLRRNLRPARRGGLQGARNADGAGMPEARGRCQARQEHVRARHAVQHLQPRPGSSRASRSR